MRNPVGRLVGPTVQVIDSADIPGLLDLSEEALIVLRRQDSDRQLPEILLVNRKLSELLGYSRTELIGRSLRALRGRGVTREAFTAFTRALSREKSEDFLLPLRAAGNHDVLTRIRVVPVPARRDLVSLWIQAGSAGDDRQGLVATILAALPTIQKLSDEHFYILEITDDLRLKMLWLDERAEATLGYSIKELERSSGLAGIVMDDDRGLLREHHQRLIAGESLETSYRVRLPNRSVRRVLDRAQALKATHSALAFHVVGSLTATSDQRESVTGNPSFIRMGAVLAGQLHALVCLVSERGDIVWSSNEPATPLADSIRRATGKDLTRYVAARHLDDWLDLVDQAFTDTAPVCGALHWPLDNAAIPVSVYAARVDEEFALLVVRPSEDLINGRPNAPALQGKGGNEFRAIELLSQPAFTIAGSGAIAEVNQAARALSHANFGDRLATGVRLQALVDPSLEGVVTEALERAKRTGEIVAIDVALGPSPQTTSIGLRLQAINDSTATRPLKLLAVIGDESEVERPSLEAGRLAAQISTVLDLANDGLLLVDAFGKIMRADAKATGMFGREGRSLEGSDLDDLLRQVDGTKGALEALVDRLAVDPSRSEIMFIAHRQELSPVEVRARLAAFQGARDYVLALRDVRLEKENEEALRFFAFYDVLTGLPNRRLFLERLVQSLEHARVNNGMVAILLLDLDRFRLINESLGFSTGDQVLSAVAGRLVAQLGEQETTARLSSDEFVILIPNVGSVETAGKTAQHLLETIRGGLVLGDHELSLSASIGLALYPSDGADAEVLMQSATTACARATEQGGNRFQFYADEMNSTALQRLMLESRLRRALEQGEFVVYYQPIARADDGHILGVEALLRWFHPEIGMVSPGEFIPLAEETGLIVPIGNWVLDVSCRQVLRWQEQFDRPELRLSVNLSARQFELDDLPATIADVLRETGFAPGLLELELTESVVMGHAEDAERRMEELTAIGVRLAIDDFGTGYSSLGYLRRFPIHALKIDRSFTMEIERDHGSLTIVKAIIGLGENLGMRIVAEGVESQAQLKLLQSLNCAEVQGYYLCRPLPAEEVMNALQATSLPLARG